MRRNNMSIKFCKDLNKYMKDERRKNLLKVIVGQSYSFKSHSMIYSYGKKATVLSINSEYIKVKTSNGTIIEELNPGHLILN
jgi:hypothetical protein